MKRAFLFLCGFIALSLTALANPVIVKMNTVSTTLTLSDKKTGTDIKIPTPTNYEFNFELDPGVYSVTGIAKDGTVNGVIDITVTDSTTVQQFTVLTCTAYVSNKETDGTPWNIENEDYKLDVTVNTREGKPIVQTPGKSTTANRYTFLALNGNSYNVAFIPSEKHQSEGYMTLYRGGTLTANVNVTGAIPQGGDFSITVPSDARLELGMKFTHFTDFTLVKPIKTEDADGGKTYSYRLANGQVYNYRTWKDGGLTHAGYFTMSLDESKCPTISFTEADYIKAAPEAINHSPQSNSGYETGDLLLNINPQHHLKLNVGDNFLVHGMRMWELTDNSTNNYFFEPDFHYTILDTDFKPSDNIIKIENCSEANTSAWSKITAKGTGTAIVLVTYDGINLNYYNNADKKNYLGGEYWGAIWPENTGVFVVSVGETEAKVDPNMTINEQYNVEALRLAGKYVDAEHDVFYFLDSEDGFPYTFMPEGVTTVLMASPEISETAATYKGFTTDGVTKNEDGSYTVLLKYGRNIIKLSDANGNSTYQVLRAKTCHREITNITRPGSKIFQPGDKFKIQYSGLFHPANKIAGIYNMSAYVTYNGIPNGSSLILGSGQYTFGSAASAQAVTVEIPEDYNIDEKPVWIMNEGVIQVNGYGDPIGNHRNTSPLAGRSPNFTAVPHKTYFGALPDISLDITPVKNFLIQLEGIPEGASVELSFNDNLLTPNDDGLFSGTYGDYSITAKADGYRCFRKIYNIPDEADGLITFNLEMEELNGAWDGVTKTEPQTNELGFYEITTPAELAWFAENTNNKGENQNATLLSDLHLGNFDWTPIGTGSTTAFTGNFEGNGHTISGLYINNPKASYMGLFGYINGASVSGITVNGSVSGKQHVGGIVGCAAGASTIDRCANYANINGSGTYVGGIVGNLNSATAELSNSYNAATVSGTSNCGGVIGGHNKDAKASNIFSVGRVIGTTVGACVGGTTAKANISNAFSTSQYQITESQTLVTVEQMASGEIAFKLGEAFNQTIGIDSNPVFDGLTVYYDEGNDIYYNNATSFTIAFSESNDDVEVTDNGIVMHVKDGCRLAVSANPEAARLPEIIWTSSNDEIISVDENGCVSANAKGEATISATGMIDDEPFTATCSISVIAANVTTLTIENKDITLDIPDNPSVVLTTSFGPEYAETPSVLWTSSDESVATIEHEGSLQATVTAITDGKTTITVELANNPAVFDTCDIFVIASSAVTDIFNDSDIKSYDIYDISGKTIKLNATKTDLPKLNPGIYIFNHGNENKKVMIK
ncbi:MAG: Ig-like domain-containing protein [Muribaculaceae bacterium]|nr:Ig-like domain-containing protein [Muribaculaceae bacterium]